MAQPMVRVRRARLSDLEHLVHHRRAMWEDMGVGTRAELDEADGVYRRWARRRLASGTLVGWIAQTSGDVVGGGCVWLQLVHPRPGFPGGPQPYLLSMYTEPAWRGRGIARRIVREAVRWSRANGYPRITLHASTAGRGIYEREGFDRTWEMKLALSRGSRATARRARPRSASRAGGAARRRPREGRTAR